ncbi:MAG: hypothetical protein EBS60_06225 [Verrucomicrobia bacterium]|nr:hypothetical protein [Verrucomicrobiota bacterium]
MKLSLIFLWGLGMGVSWGAGKWGMVDTNGTWRLSEKYEEVGEFRGDLKRSFTLPEFLPGVKGAKVRKWLKAEGDEVKGGEPLAQVELTEPALPVEAPISGMLVKIGVPAGGAAIPGSALGSVRNLSHVGLFEKKQFDVVCPGYGPNPGSATLVRWIKDEGDAVVKGEKIAEVRPKEAMAMLQAPGSGTLVKIEVKDGEEAKVGQAVARMGIGRVPVKLGGEWFYADERGTRVTQDRYQEVGSMLGGMAPVRVGEKWAFVDGEGRLIPKAMEGKKGKGFNLGIVEKAEYDAARKVRGGLAAVRVMDRWGYVAYQEEGIRMAIAPRFLQAKDFSEGLAAVEESEDAPVADGTEVVNEVKSEEEAKKSQAPAAWGYILPSGKLWGRLDFAVAGDFLDGRAVVQGLGESMPFVLIDSKIKTRTTKNYGGLVLLGEKRVAWRQSGGWGLMDLQERVLEIRPGIKNQDGEGVGQDVLEAVGPYGNDRAPAKEPGGKWGYLDLEGKWAIEPRFERALVFHGGLAPAKEPGGKWGYLKPDGSWALEPKYTKARAFTDGLAAVSEQGEVELGPEGTTGGVWE